MHRTRPVCADGGKEVLGLQTMGYVIEFLAVASKEDGARAGAVTNAYHVALHIRGTVGRGCERLIVAAGTDGGVGYRSFVPA